MDGFNGNNMDTNVNGAPTGFDAGNQGFNANQANNNNYTQQAAQPVKNSSAPDFVLWLILNIIATLCCCLPTGVAGLVLAIVANTSYQNNDMENYQSKMKASKILFGVSIGIGVIIVIAYVIFAVVAAGSGYSSYSTY